MEGLYGGGITALNAMSDSFFGDREGLRDGIVLTDGRDTVIYNQRSYCRLLQGLIAAYTTASPAEAAACVEAHRGYFTGIDDVLSASLESHSYPYYYAAVELYFGVHPAPVEHPDLTGPPPDSPEGAALYREVEERILSEEGMREPFEWE